MEPKKSTGWSLHNIIIAVDVLLIVGFFVVSLVSKPEILRSRVVQEGIGCSLEVEFNGSPVFAKTLLQAIFADPTSPVQVSVTQSIPNDTNAVWRVYPFPCDGDFAQKIAGLSHVIVLSVAAYVLLHLLVLLIYLVRRKRSYNVAFTS